MTKEELEMRRLVRESDVIDKTDGTELTKAFNHLWEKYIEQEPCGDAISRQAVLELVADYDLSMGQVVRGIHALPSVTQEPKTGHWIRWYEQKEYDGYIDNIPHCKCSECGEEYDPHSSQFIKYCNECGARMSES